MSDTKTANWTPSQETAIYDSGKQLLVAAGAGSGKTSVLTQRILEKIKGGSDVKDFLVVTFTVASAEDMKEKLRRKLAEELVKDPDNKHVSKQIAKLPFAQISTMSAYCIKLIKQNFTLLDLSPNLRVADESEVNALFEEAFDTLLDEKFSAKDDSLYVVLNETACMGKEDYLFKYLYRIYSKIRAHSNYINKLKALAESFQQSAKMCLNGEEVISTPIGKSLTEALNVLCAEADEKIDLFSEKGAEFGGVLESLAEDFAKRFKDGKSHAEKGELAKSADCYDAAINLYSSAWKKKTTFSGLDEEEKKSYNDLRKSARDAAEEVRDFIDEIASCKEDIIQCAKIAVGVKDLIIRLDEIFTQIKKEKGVVDFPDAEQYTHMLLIDQNGNATPLCKEIADSLEEVLVDEYQDTNPLQDEIFASLATKNNRFMVGDDKQSIYRFRNAYPDIFNGYKKSFNSETARCIFLRENFRCSKQIIDFTNSVFDFLWGDTYKAECLKFAKKGGENSPAVTVKTFIGNTTNVELEAKYIRNEILKLKQTYIKENGEPLQYSDIAVLLSSAKTAGEIFAEEFRKSGIPVISGKPGPLTEAPEVKVVLSYLKAVNNPLEDIPLASAMNSFFFGFTADELVKIRNIKNTSLYESIIKYCGERKHYPKMRFVRKKSLHAKGKKTPHFRKKSSDALVEKCKLFIKELKELRYRARTTECRQFIWESFEKHNVLNAVASLPDGETKKGNLLLLYSEAIAFGKRERKSLSAFIKHADKLCTSAYSPDGMNSVSIMTIHSSKGLEFPVCFLANAGKSLLSRSSGIKLPIVRMEKGIFTPLKTNDLYTKYPVLYKAEEISEKPLEIAERKRLLYVALTRAREKLYVVGTGKSIDALQSSSPNAPTSFLSWVHSSQAQAEYLTAETEEFEEYEDYTPSQESVADLPFEEAEEFVYPFEESVKIPRKLSVSALEQTSKEKYKTTVRKKDFLTTPRFATETKKVSAAEIGTANHTFMQFASFENCVNMGVEYEGDRLLMEEMITAEQYKMLNFKSLRRFFQSPLWKRISKSSSVFREKRFTVANNSHDLLGVGNETVLVQGVIDLFFENEDGTFTVVDYKTDKIKKGEEHILMERYKGQLSYYASAVKEMTEKDVKECIIYSFALDKEILLPL